MIARNEAQFIQEAIDSVRGLVHQMIVVDTGSVDDTIQIARESGATVVEAAWTNDFSAARNEALEHVTSQWVLILDADERLCKGSAHAIEAALRADQFDCGFLPLHNASKHDALPAEVLSGACRRGDPVLLPRIFRFSASLKWEGVVHETPSSWYRAGQRSLKIDAPIIHFGNVPSLRKAKSKAQRNLQLLERQCALHPGDPIALTYLARELHRSGRTAAAKEAIEEAWSRLNANREAAAAGPMVDWISTATLRAFMLLNEQRYSNALDTVSRCQEVVRPHPNLYLLQASALEQLGDEESLTSAVSALEACLSLHGQSFMVDMLPGATSWAAWNLLGLVRLRQGRASEALSAFDAALRSGSAQELTRVGRCLALAASGRGHESLTSAEPLLSRERSDGWIAAALACLKLRRFEDAQTFLEHSESLPPPSLEYIGQIRRRAWAHLRAQEWLESLIEGPPPPVDRPVVSLVELGEARFEGGDLDGAIDLFLRALAKDSALPEAWTNLAVAFHARGYCEEARNAFHIALSLHPNHPDTRFNLGLFQVEEGRFVEAAFQFRSLLLQNSDNHEAKEALRAIGVEGDLPPLALVVSTPGNSHLRTAVRAGLMLSGWRDRDATPDILRALSPRRKRREAIGQYLAAVGAGLLVLDPSARHARYWREMAADLNIPVALFPSGIDPSPGASQPLLRLPTNVDAILRAFPKANPKSRGATTQEISPVMSVLLQLGPNTQNHAHILDRLAIQHLSPRFFEVVIASTHPVDTDLLNSNRPYAIRMLEPGHSLVQALQACQGRWVVMFDDEGMPELDTLRRHLVAQLSSAGPTAIVGEQVYTPSPTSTLANLLSVRPDLAHGSISTSRSTVLLFRARNCSIPMQPIRSIQVSTDLSDRSAEEQCLDLAARLALMGVSIERAPHIQTRFVGEPSLTTLQNQRAKRGAARFEAWTRHGGNSLLTVEPSQHRGHPAWLIERKNVEMLMQQIQRDGKQLRHMLRTPLPRGPKERAARLKSVAALLVRALHAQEHRGLVQAATNEAPFAHIPPRNARRPLLSVIVPIRSATTGWSKCIASLRNGTGGPVQALLAPLSEDVAVQDFPADIQLLQVSGSSTERISQAVALSSADHVVVMDPAVTVSPGWADRLLGLLRAWDDTGVVFGGPNLTPSHPQMPWAPFAPPASISLFHRGLWEAAGGLDPAFQGESLARCDLWLRLELLGFRARWCEKVIAEAPEPPNVLAASEADRSTFAKRWHLPEPLGAWEQMRTEHVRQSGPALRALLTPLSPQQSPSKVPLVLLDNLTDDRQA